MTKVDWSLSSLNESERAMVGCDLHSRTVFVEFGKTDSWRTAAGPGLKKQIKESMENGNILEKLLAMLPMMNVKPIAKIDKSFHYASTKDKRRA